MGWMQINEGKLIGKWFEITYAIADEASFEDCLALLVHEFEYPLIVYKSKGGYEVIRKRKDFASFLEKNEYLLDVMYRIYNDMKEKIVVEIGSEDLQEGMEGVVKKVMSEVESKLASRAMKLLV